MCITRDLSCLYTRFDVYWLYYGDLYAFSELLGSFVIIISILISVMMIFNWPKLLDETVRTIIKIGFKNNVVNKNEKFFSGLARRNYEKLLRVK